MRWALNAENHRSVRVNLPADRFGRLPRPGHVPLQLSGEMKMALGGVITYKTVVT